MENITKLINYYKHMIEQLEQEIKLHRNNHITLNQIFGRIQTYKAVIKDLKEIEVA